MDNTPDSLSQLWLEVESCKLCAPRYEAGELSLKHMLGVGKQSEPEIMFVLMNPTGRNLTLQPDYDGSPLPYGGIKAFWKVLVEAGLLPPELMSNFEPGVWNESLTSYITALLTEKGYYITELVKCPSPKAANPTPAMITNGLELLKREIELVKPTRIVTFGGLVFQALTQKKVKLEDYLLQLENGTANSYFAQSASGQPYEVFPCYFPTGRGNSKAAIRCLKVIANLSQ